jgi:transcriptional regulator with XRE-family HTH domain
MANTISPLLPQTEELLQHFGERLRLARLRRRLQARQVAQRAGMTEVTLRRVERGMPGVTIAAYLAVMQVLQLQEEVGQWATNDPLGRHLQDTQAQGGMRPRRARRGPPAEAVQPGVAEDQLPFLAGPAKSAAPPVPAQAPAPEKEAARQPGSGSSISSSDLLKVLRRPRKPDPGQA